ncbi:hypothetical protein PC118_g17118 [Phytophthora cactorum]|uniref:Uncharacterized protein n=1 Tax=Phytophthora cactorum TaxID=29920 RepID=A0A8T1FIW7_9STRA|nr:hypothetical protein PC118_g17118 [Phytophthora cactorum]
MRHPVPHNHTKHAEDKLVVQIAFQFEREGLRITWDYGLVLALLGLQTALGRASAAPTGKKVMSIVRQEVVAHAEDLRLGGWQVPTVYQTWCILVAKMEWVLPYTASTHLN